MEDKAKIYTKHDILNAIEFGKDIRSEKSKIVTDSGNHYIYYDDSTEETNEYILNLKKGKRNTTQEWLEKRIKITTQERDNSSELNLIIGKGGKNCVYKECLNYFKTH